MSYHTHPTYPGISSSPHTALHKSHSLTIHILNQTLVFYHTQSFPIPTFSPYILPKPQSPTTHSITQILISYHTQPNTSPSFSSYTALPNPQPSSQHQSPIMHILCAPTWPYTFFLPAPVSDHRQPYMCSILISSHPPSTSLRSTTALPEPPYHIQPSPKHPSTITHSVTFVLVWPYTASLPAATQLHICSSLTIPKLPLGTSLSTYTALSILQFITICSFSRETCPLLQCLTRPNFTIT